ncbi:hypothetical protein JCM9279_000423 [Rhodotorula babjevae]
MSYQPPYAPPPPTYTILLRGSPFHLSSSQIRTDSPNHFTGVFLGGNGGCSVYYSDRRPTYFDLIVEWLSGYDDFLGQIQPRDGMSELQALHALKAEADHFELKGLAKRVDHELAKCAERGAALRLAAQHVRDRAPTMVSLIEDFRDAVRAGDSSMTRLMRGVKSGPPQLFAFTSLEVGFDCRSLDDDDDDDELPDVRVNFLDDEVRQATQTYEGTKRRTIKVDISDKSSEEASANVDDVRMSLAVLLRWIVKPTQTTSKYPALRPLVDYLHPELTPRDERVVTVHVREVVAHWSHGKLRLVRLSIRSQDQGHYYLA